MRKAINPKLFTVALAIIALECTMIRFRSRLPFNVAYVIIVVNFLYFNFIFFPDVRRRYKALKQAEKQQDCTG
jgi:hypothetical protein